MLVAVTLAVYWPVRLNDFVNYDDGEYLTGNPHLQSELNWPFVRWAFTTGYAANWHPLTWISHALDVQLFSLQPAGHHLVNLAFHAANTLLLFWFLVRTTRGTWRSACVAALFALHPLHVESVAWASERKDVLSTCFGLLALLAYAKYVSRGEGRGEKMGDGKPGTGDSRITHHASRATGWYLLALLLFALSLMSKPMLVTLPFLLLLLDDWPLRRLPFANRKSAFKHLLPLLLEKVPFLLLSALSCTLTLLVQQGAMSYYRGLPFSQRAANAALACVRYVGKTFWPRNLAVFYPHPEHPPVGQTAAAALLLVVLCGLALACWRRRPFVTVGWFWFLGTLVPVLGLVQVGMQAMADRYTYLPLVGLFIVLVWTLSAWLDRVPAARLPATGAAILLLGLCAGATHTQVAVWRNSESLFRHAAAVTPENWVAHQNLAAAALERYQDTEHGAIENQVLRLQPPGSPDSLNQTVRHCEATLLIRPRNLNARLILAKALIELGQLDDALPHLQMVLRLSPTNAVAHQNLADLYYRQHRPKEAVAQYQAALEQVPDWPAVLNNLAWLLATHPQADLRDGPQALRLAERASTLTSHTNLWYLHTLAAAYAETAQFSQAVEIAQQARQLAAASGQSNLLATAEHRLQLYRAHTPWRDP